MQNNEQFIHYVNTEKETYQRIYTDGSKTKESVKAAFYDSESKFGRCFTLDANTSIFTAEAYAIWEALKYVERNCRNSKFLIITDSLSVLKSLESSKLSYKTNCYIYCIREHLNNLLQSGRIVEFLWVPSHSGISGNEIVDRLMKIQHTQNLSERTVPSVPLTDYYSIIKQRMYTHWSKDWEHKKQFKGRWYAQIQLQIPIKPWYFSLESVSRKFITTMNRLRLGHAKFPAHLKKIKIISSDTCEHCKTETGTLDHLILQCPAFSVQRLLLIDGLLKIYKTSKDIPRLLPSILQNINVYTEIYKFIICTLEEM